MQSSKYMFDDESLKMIRNKRFNNDRQDEKRSIDAKRFDKLRQQQRQQKREWQ